MQTRHHRKALLIYTHGAGRLGNQLFAYAHLLAFVEEHPDDFELINLSFIPYSTFLAQPPLLPSPTPEGHPVLHFLATLATIDPSQGKVSWLPEKVLVNCARLLHGYGAIAPHGQSLIVGDIYYWSFIAGQRLEHLDLASPAVVEQLNRKAFSVLAGWSIRSWQLVAKHENAIRQKLAIHPRYATVATTFIDGLRQQYDFLVGVAIRQGDYRSSAEVFKRFLFESDQYARWIEQAAVAFAGKGRVGFVITADEPQEREMFGPHVHFSTGIAGGNGHYLESLMELALCDVLLTSATTFGIWAAFLGNIPIILLWDANQQVQADAVVHYLEALQQFDQISDSLLQWSR
ncbi:MAG TPA: alpha-1,2-fucosyltransferase [Stenomitos sp.]